MAADEPAKAPPLYEVDPDKSTASRSAWPRWPGVAGNGHETRSAAALACLLAACGQASQPATEQSGRAKAPPAAKPAAPPPKAFVVDEKNDLVEFHFAWSAEAAAVPELVNPLPRRMEKVKADSERGREGGQGHARQGGLRLQRPMSSTELQNGRPVRPPAQPAADVGAYTGGAHGNYGTSALLWDRAGKREIKFADLFAAPANRDRLLTQRWCDALNKAREEKRGEPVGGGGMFDDCPKLDEIAIIPTDSDGNGRFERLILIASPYVAGPYVGGRLRDRAARHAGPHRGARKPISPSFEAQSAAIIRDRRRLPGRAAAPATVRPACKTRRPAPAQQSGSRR